MQRTHLQKTQKFIVKTQIIAKYFSLLMTLSAIPYNNTLFFDVFDQHK